MQPAGTCKEAMRLSPCEAPECRVRGPVPELAFSGIVRPLLGKAYTAPVTQEEDIPKSVPAPVGFSDRMAGTSEVLANPRRRSPSTRVRAVDDASQETQPFPDVVPIAPDILLGDSCIQAEETFHAFWFTKDVGGMA